MTSYIVPSKAFNGVAIAQFSSTELRRREGDRKSLVIRFHVGGEDTVNAESVHPANVQWVLTVTLSEQERAKPQAIR